MADDGFHEIQLNGKQLIFLCMTATLVLVVAFLSGVLVGRGVHAQKDVMVAADAMASPSPAADAGPLAAAPTTQAPAAPPITAIAPPTPADEDLSYNRRLEGKQPPEESLEPQKEPRAGEPAKGAVAKDAAKVPAARPAPPAAMARPGTDAANARAEASVPAEPAGSGYYLKVVAYRERTQADAVARRLSGKGYTAYVVPASGRGPVLYSVRVGKYKTRREADSTRRRLEKEEQFKPLISR